MHFGNRVDKSIDELFQSDRAKELPTEPRYLCEESDGNQSQVADGQVLAELILLVVVEIVRQLGEVINDPVEPIMVEAIHLVRRLFTVEILYGVFDEVGHGQFLIQSQDVTVMGGFDGFESLDELWVRFAIEEKPGVGFNYIDISLDRVRKEDVLVNS